MKRFKYVFSLLFLTIALGVATYSATIKKNFFSARSAVGGYTLVLSSSNCGALPKTRKSTVQQTDSASSPATSLGNRIIFKSQYAIGPANINYSMYAMNLSSESARKGYFANVTALTGITSITVVYDNESCQLFTGNSVDNYNSPITIQSGVRYQVDHFSHFKITAVDNDSSIASINITSITIKYMCDSQESLPPVMSHTHHGCHYLAKEATADAPGNREFYTCDECQYVSLVKEDNGTYIDTVLTYDLPSTHIAYIAPIYNLHNEYLRNVPQIPYPIAVNMELPNSTYNFDNTGTTDCSTVIQQALDDLKLKGGGTIYIPTGKYRLDNHLTIPNRVTLVGDFYGPDADNYGTVFLCYKAHDSSLAFYKDSQVHLSSNSAINGITFYYPNQNINSVIEYGYTISTRSNAAVNMANLLFINSYNGITINCSTAGGGELSNIENVYGTFLKNGVVGYVQTDVGFWSNINISPSYYANALSEYRCSDSAALNQYVSANLTGLTLGDLDDFGLHHINVDNANIGILFPDQCVRTVQHFWGFLNDVNLTNCTTGVDCRGIYARGAALFTHSSLGNIVNSTEFGMLKLSKCRWNNISGDGKTLIESGSETYEAAPVVDDTNTFNIPNYLYYFDSFDGTGATDISTALQTEIDKIQTGGVIVLKNGTYRLDNPITIPDNTMITTFCASFTRSAKEEGSNESIKFISYSDDACIKLGNYSGINGIRIYNAYKDIDTAYNKLANSQSDSFVAVKGIGNHCFAINTEASYAFTAFDFSNVSNHYMKYCYGGVYETFVKAGTSGKIIASLSDWSFLSRTNLASFAVANNTALDKYAQFESDSTKSDFVIDMLRDYTTMIVINNSSSETLLNCFAYGYKCLVNTTNSTVLAVNTSIDYLKDDNYSYVVNGGDVTVVNTFRVFGKSFNRISGHLRMYGRYDFTMKKEAYYDSDINPDDPYIIMPSSGLTTQSLSTCENTIGVSGASRSSAPKHGGSYSWRASSTINPTISYSFTARNISSFYNKGYLRLYVYCQNINNKGTNHTLELTSSGTYDDQEMSYDIDSQITATGWNEIIVDLSDGLKGSSSDFNRTNCNFFRFWALNANNCYYYIDDIDFLYES